MARTATPTTAPAQPSTYTYVVFPPGSTEPAESFPSIRQAQAFIAGQDGGGWRLETHAA